MTPSDTPAPRVLVVALGGNALQRPEDDDSVAGDFDRTAETARHLRPLIASGEWRVVVTHGNGPQVGNHLLRGELGYEHGATPLLPLDVCVADTQGGMGYMIQQSLANELAAADVPAVVASLVTQVLVDVRDPAFDRPSKPVGESVPEERVAELESRGWTLVEDRHHGWRRVVPSPDPVEVVEAEAVRALVAAGVTVVAAGGGGVPVVQRSDGSLEGVAAVVDKDLASALLAADLQAAGLVILTDVAQVALGFGTPGERPIDRMTVRDARRYLERGEFPAGSMGPKVEAVCRFVEACGGTGVITSIDRCVDGVYGRAGTRIVR
ncbi:MAG TPA: carbamate kinase [Actinomycetota bacterium]|nr:carbamate kinase [Actinomycetota bacterium]